MARKVSPKRGKEKGNEFERFIAKKILEAAGAPFSKTDCYRTPMSGGHPFADSGDLVLSPNLRIVVPFVIECKHQKEWKVHFVFEQNKLFAGWMEQALAEQADSRSHGRTMLLIMNGNLTGAYCVVSLTVFRDYIAEYNKNASAAPRLTFTYKFTRYVMFQLPVLLAAIKKAAVAKRANIIWNK